MKNAILVHGRPEKEEYFDDSLPKPHKAHWFPWLKEQLEEKGIPTEIPIMPRPYQPDYDEWKSEFEKYQVNPETILVGHSRGGGFLLRYLSENKIEVGKLVLVAPSTLANPGVVSGFYEYTMDPDLPKRTKGFVVLYSTDDEEGIIKSVEKIKSSISNITIREFTNKGHFTEEELGTKEFPELLEEILK